MVTMRRPLIYLVGVDPLMARAVASDLARAVLRRRRPVPAHGVRCRRGLQPDLLLVDISVTRVQEELMAAWAAWGDRLVIVGVGRHEPYAYIWRRPGAAERVEVGPGFLTPLLPEDGCAAANSR